MNIISLPKNYQFVLGLSGGVDSIALFHYLLEHKINFRVVHVHHGISKNANDWLSFCHNLCSKNNIKIQSFKVKLDDNKNLEEDARIKRYEAIKSTMNDNEILITAHHANDQVETMLHNMIRGAGVNGLNGMEIKTVLKINNFEVPVFRPLLLTSKKEILNYAQEKNLSWVEDESNKDDSYSRNFFRLNIIPKLQEKFPAFIKSMVKLSFRLKESNELLEDLAKIDLEKYFNLNNNSFSIHELNQLKESRLKNMLYYYAKENFNIFLEEKHIQEIKKIINSYDTNKSTKKPYAEIKVNNFFIQLNKNKNDFNLTFSENIKLNNKMKI